MRRYLVALLVLLLAAAPATAEEKPGLLDRVVTYFATTIDSILDKSGVEQVDDAEVREPLEEDEEISRLFEQARRLTEEGNLPLARAAERKAHELQKQKLGSYFERFGAVLRQLPNPAERFTEPDTEPDDSQPMGFWRSSLRSSVHFLKHNSVAPIVLLGVPPLFVFCFLAFLFSSITFGGRSVAEAIDMLLLIVIGAGVWGFFGWRIWSYLSGDAPSDRYRLLVEVGGLGVAWTLSFAGMTAGSRLGLQLRGIQTGRNNRRASRQGLAFRSITRVHDWLGATAPFVLIFFILAIGIGEAFSGIPWFFGYFFILFFLPLFRQMFRGNPGFLTTVLRIALFLIVSAAFLSWVSTYYRAWDDTGWGPLFLLLFFFPVLTVEGGVSAALSYLGGGPHLRLTRSEEDDLDTEEHEREDGPENDPESV